MSADSVVIIQGDAGVSSKLDEVLSTADPGIVVDAAPGAPPLPPNWPAGAKLQPDGSVILGLQWPVRFKLRDTDGSIRNGDSYEELRLGRLKGKHKILLAKTSERVPFEKAIIGCSTGLDAGKIELLYGELDQADIAAIMVVLTFFYDAWPGDWPGALAKLGHWYHWPRAELEDLDDRDAAFWMMAIRIATRPAED